VGRRDQLEDRRVTIGRRALQVDRDRGMVGEVGADAGKVGHDGAAERGQLGGGADARTQQQGR
jgi:hypothetical protein